MYQAAKISNYNFQKNNNMASEEELVLVTGATGYIATHIVQQLLQAGYRVRGTVRSLKNEEKVKPLYELCPEANDKLELVECNLLDENCWDAAVKDCTYVLHTASPVPLVNPKDEDEVIKPAVDGTMFVLRASQKAGTVKRIVLTSSAAAIVYFANPKRRFLTEQDWSDLKYNNISVYSKSKTLAEKAAWDFIKENGKMEMATINPTYVLGPIICGGYASIMVILKRLLNAQAPILPNLSFAICDVRDVAAAHVKAMTVPEAAGHRHIVDNGSLWYYQIANVVDEEFRRQGYKIPTRTAPNFFFHIVALFDGTVKRILPALGNKSEFDNSRLRNVLGITPIPIQKSILDMCYSLIETGRVKKTPEYRGN